MFCLRVGTSLDTAPMIFKQLLGDPKFPPYFKPCSTFVGRQMEDLVNGTDTPPCYLRYPSFADICSPSPPNGLSPSLGIAHLTPQKPSDYRCFPVGDLLPYQPPNHPTPGEFFSGSPNRYRPDKNGDHQAIRTLVSPCREDVNDQPDDESLSATFL